MLLNQTNKPESVLDNETRKFLWDFEMTDDIIPARRSDGEFINKKKEFVILWALPFQRNTEKRKDRQIQGHVRELKKK